MSTAAKSAGRGKTFIVYATPDFIFKDDPDGHPWIPAARLSCTSSRDFARATLSRYKDHYPDIFAEIEHGFRSGEMIRASSDAVPLIELGLIIPTSANKTLFELHPAAIEVFLEEDTHKFDSNFEAPKIPGLKPPSKLTLVRPEEELSTGFKVPFSDIKTPEQKRAAVLDNFDYCEYRLKVMQEFQGDLYASLKLFCNSPTSISFGEVRLLIDEGFIDPKTRAVPFHIKLRMDTGNPIPGTSIPKDETSMLFDRDLGKRGRRTNPRAKKNTLVESK